MIHIECEKSHPENLDGFYFKFRFLEPFVEFTRGTTDEHSAADASLAVFHTFDNACRFAALGAVSALGGVHFFLAVTGLGDLGHFVELRFVDYMREAAIGPIAESIGNARINGHTPFTALFILPQSLNSVVFSSSSAYHRFSSAPTLSRSLWTCAR